MGFWMFVSSLVTLMMMADEWGGPHWLAILGQGIIFMACPTALVISLIYSVRHEARTTPTHSQPSHDDQQKKNK